jgi:hypothetical protein
VPLPSLSGVPPFSNTVYVVFLPLGTTVVNPPSFAMNLCTNDVAYHSADASFTFAYVVVPMACAGNRNSLTDNLTHELAEAVTDPVWPLGFSDRARPAPSTLPLPGGHSLPIGTAGENADVCEPPIRTPTAFLSVGGLLEQVSPYWSNSDGACVNGACKLTEGTCGSTCFDAARHKCVNGTLEVICAAGQASCGQDHCFDPATQKCAASGVVCLKSQSVCNGRCLQAGKECITDHERFCMTHPNKC